MSGDTKRHDIIGGRVTSGYYQRSDNQSIQTGVDSVGSGRIVLTDAHSGSRPSNFKANARFHWECFQSCCIGSLDTCIDRMKTRETDQCFHSLRLKLTLTLADPRAAAAEVVTQKQHSIIFTVIDAVTVLVSIVVLDSEARDVSGALVTRKFATLFDHSFPLW